MVVHNKFPILGLSAHIMAVPKRHILLAQDISADIMSQYPKALKFVHEFYKGKKYFSFMRESVESRSLEHLHYHFISGTIGYKDLEHFLKKQGF
jgi:diadenosine tetraphosphate (Ap4A) HIT family hydrolase